MHVIVVNKSQEFSLNKCLSTKKIVDDDARDYFDDESMFFFDYVVH